MTGRALGICVTDIIKECKLANRAVQTLDKPCSHINLLKLENKKSTWEDLSREVAQIFDGTTVKARPRKMSSDVDGIGQTRTSMRGTTNQTAESLELVEKELERQTPGYQGQITVSSDHLDWESEN